MKRLKKPIVYTIIVAILYSYTGSVYLGNYYRITELLNANAAELYMMRIGYFLQAAGMFLYAFLYKKYNKLINSTYGSIGIIALSIIPMCFVQISANVKILIGASFIFNLITGMILEMYLVELNYNVPNNHLALCYGIAYAFGSIFTFLVTYFDGGKFMESPEMTIVYILMVTISAILLLNGKAIENKKSVVLNHKTKKYIYLLSASIIIGTIVVALGDGIYNFGMWTSDADIRIVRAFYALGLITAGYIFDRSRRVGTILTVAFLSYYIISAFLVNNIISPSAFMSLGYVFMSFISVYRYVGVADMSRDYPQFIPCAGFGLMISRVAEGLTSLLMMIFPVSLTVHIIITLLFYSPLVVIAIVTDSVKYSPSEQFESQHFIKICEKYGLTSREQEIAKMILENASDDEISSKLYISKPTVRFHISNIFKKTKTKSRIEIRRLFEK